MTDLSRVREEARTAGGLTIATNLARSAPIAVPITPIH